MTMISSLTSTYIAVILLSFLFLLSPSYCLNHKHHSDTFRGFVVAAEKARLGSTPPSCHNKCNQCHPCMAVQVPTLPSHDRVQPTSARQKPMDYFDSSPSSSAGNRFGFYDEFSGAQYHF
ncbi:hypothetical protein OROGR_019069 [Orobanche gracilis]